MLPKNVLYYGNEGNLPPPIPLQAGDLTLQYLPGEIRSLKFGDREAIVRLYVAVRDRYWRTIPARFSDVNLQVNTRSFRITFFAEHQQDDIDFCWQGEIWGTEASHLGFVMDGRTRSSFWRNRIGICVHHPIAECIGQPCTLQKCDGTSEYTNFPVHIAPHQVFQDFQGMSYAVADSTCVELHFFGDTFETEDQRNWTDTSFKTYSTPIGLPHPVEVMQGTAIAQTVELSLRRTDSAPPPFAPPFAQPRELTFRERMAPALSMPQIGLGIASHGFPLSDGELARLRLLNLSHLRVELYLGDLPNGDFERAVDEASQLGLSLEIALHLPELLPEQLESALSDLATWLQLCKPAIARWAILGVGGIQLTEDSLTLARTYLRGLSPTAQFAIGSNIYFMQVNRLQPAIVKSADLICYPITPQVHAFDNTSLVENLVAQGMTVTSARQKFGLPVCVSPVTFKPRFNPNIPGSDRESFAPHSLPFQVDPRQMSLLGAGWTIGSFKYLAEAGACSITYYETTGWRGVMEREAGLRLPDEFPSLPGAVFPLCHVFQDLGEFADGEVVPSASSNPLQLEGVVLRCRGRQRYLLANLTGDRHEVWLPELHGQVQLRLLDETNAQSAMQSPQAFRQAEVSDLAASDLGIRIELRPYAIAVIDSEFTHAKNPNR